jgi:hypothetical protein
MAKAFTLFGAINQCFRTGKTTCAGVRKSSAYQGSVASNYRNYSLRDPVVARPLTQLSVGCHSGHRLEDERTQFPLLQVPSWI